MATGREVQRKAVLTQAVAGVGEVAAGQLFLLGTRRLQLYAREGIQHPPTADQRPRRPQQVRELDDTSGGN
jgi:hypothetical protein